MLERGVAAFLQFGWGRRALEVAIRAIALLPGAREVQTALEMLAAGVFGSYYLGQFADNNLALAYIVANGLDTDTPGFPNVGHCYWNTTLGCIRQWNGTIWYGRPWQQDTGRTVYVRSTGSDAGGAGTLLDPYLTLDQALQDMAEYRVPLHPSVEAWVINYQETGTFTIGPVAGDGYVLDCGNPESEEIQVRGQAFVNWTLIGDWNSNAAGGVDRDAYAAPLTGLHGRRLDFSVAAPGWVAGELWDCATRNVRAANGGVANSSGWVVDNGVDWVQFEINFDTYGVLANGDPIQLYRPATILQTSTGGLGTLAIRGAISFQEVRLTAERVEVYPDSFADWLQCVLSVGGGVPGSPLVLMEGSHVTIRNTAARCAIDQRDGSVLEFDGSSHGAIRRPVVWSGPGFLSRPGRATLSHVGRVVWAPNSGNPLILAPQTDLVVPREVPYIAGYYLRLYEVDSLGWDGTYGRMNWSLEFPDTTGDCLTALVVLNAGTMEPLRGTRMSFGADCQVYIAAVPATPNYCTDGAAAWYNDEALDIRIYGTGNLELLLTEPHDWVGTAATPAIGAWIGRNECIEFADAADLSSEGGFRIPPSYIPVTALELEFLYVTGDPGSGHFAEVELDSGLYRAGIDDFSADPPANLNQDLNNLVPVSTVAGRLMQSQRFAISAAGAIAGIPLAEGQYIGLTLRRLGNTGAGDDCAGALDVALNSIRVWMVGL